MTQIVFPEMSVTSYRLTPRNMPEERRPRFYTPLFANIFGLQVVHALFM